MTDLVALVETMREVQAAINMYDGPLAHYHSAWGDLNSAMKLTLAEHYRTQGLNPASARISAERVIDEMYDNGEDIAYNMRLLATARIHPCVCEHSAHDPGLNLFAAHFPGDDFSAHPYLKAPAGARMVNGIGYVCDVCADGHMAPFLAVNRPGDE